MLASAQRPMVRPTCLRGSGGAACGSRLQISSTWCFPGDHVKATRMPNCGHCKSLKFKVGTSHGRLHCRKCRSQCQRASTMVILRVEVVVSGLVECPRVRVGLGLPIAVRKRRPTACGFSVLMPLVC